MSHKKHALYKANTHEAREHREWVETLETWRIEHKKALAKLTKMQAALMEHDAEIEGQLAQIRRHTRFIEYENEMAAQTKNGEATPAEPNPFGTQEEHHKEHRALRRMIKEAQKTHQRTQEALGKTIETMQGIRADSFVNDTDSKSGADDDELIHQAGLESFPASDPPSFNPSNI